ncbi:PilT/PilU family type 4a pilus ATPase [Caenimonas koreensis]|uniref:PilT/PilU family type 4a pilus ATPase n=1 Tax=Caenimonas koreensis TaxID=367474 RepID=UPI003784650C
MHPLPTADAQDLRVYLRYLSMTGGSDLFFSVGSPPALKVQGIIRAMGLPPLAPGSVRQLAHSVMNEAQVAQFERDLEYDLAVVVEGAGRFRLNVFMQRGEVGLVARFVKDHIPSLAQLRMPAQLADLAMLERGLVLAVGAAGSGKSTTLAAMIDCRNAGAPGHILTVEDPIEFLHGYKRCVVDQREVGMDTHTFADALRHAMREAPDVIMIGEIRDAETMQHALSYADTGHLCLSTMHASNAAQAIERIVNFFPADARQRTLMDLSINLKGIIGQRLIHGRGGKLVPATELMLQSPFIADLIERGRIDDITAAIGRSEPLGMHTFDQSLHELFVASEITAEQAIEHADSKTDVALRIRLGAGAAAAGSDLSMQRG